MVKSRRDGRIGIQNMRTTARKFHTVHLQRGTTIPIVRQSTNGQNTRMGQIVQSPCFIALRSLFAAIMVRVLHFDLAVRSGTDGCIMHYHSVRIRIAVELAVTIHRIHSRTAGCTQIDRTVTRDCISMEIRGLGNSITVIAPGSVDSRCTIRITFVIGNMPYPEIIAPIGCRGEEIARRTGHYGHLLRCRPVFVITFVILTFTDTIVDAVIVPSSPLHSKGILYIHLPSRCLNHRRITHTHYQRRIV